MLMFDKSFLESLNPDEAVWLDQYFLTNITPLFFVETLADLEKEVRRGRTPEQVVGNLALKTPDMRSHMSPHHMSLLWAEFNGETITMDGRIMRAGAQIVELDGQKGVIYKMSKEEEAFNRWQHGEFLDLERQIAKAWRRDVSNVDHSKNYALFKNFYGSIRRPKSLADAKHLADTLIDLIEEELSIRFGLSLLGVPQDVHDFIVGRWAAGGKRSIGEFAPYFRHMFSVDLFFHLSIAADLISRVRPAVKADNKVDIAYLYYVPFCMIFVSNDKLHERVVPLFLRSDQSFVKGPDVKADLKGIDQHFDRLPDEVKSKDLFKFASDLPEEACPLIVQLWDKHLPTWRKQKAEHKPLPPDMQKALMEMINRAQEESTPINPKQHPSIEDISYVHISRKVYPRKGKWLRVPPEAKDPHHNDGL
jgi:hypothetical protein